MCVYIYIYIYIYYNIRSMYIRYEVLIVFVAV